MTCRDFLADRMVFIAAFAGNALLIMAVAQLDLLQKGTGLLPANLFYMAVLSAFGLGCCLLFDYLRYRPFLVLLRNLSSQDAVFNSSHGPTCVATREQTAFMQLLAKQRRDYLNTLEEYRRKQEFHNHFTNQWVHFMKTPVSIIDLLTQRLGGIETIEEAKALLESIQEENDRLVQGLEMALHVARMQKFELDLSVRTVDILGVTRKAINERKKEFIRFSIRPTILCSKDSVEVQTDEKWMSFVLGQILSNAIKYTKQSGKLQKSITVKLTEQDNRVVLSVSDNGIGIPPQDLPRIFEPFFTGENGRSNGESTGMGLYLAKEVCNRIGHKLLAESQQGEGTTVKLVFSSDSIITETIRS